MTIQIDYSFRGDDVPQLPIYVEVSDEEQFRSFRFFNFRCLRNGEFLEFNDTLGRTHYINGLDIIKLRMGVYTEKND